MKKLLAILILVMMPMLATAGTCAGDCANDQIRGVKLCCRAKGCSGGTYAPDNSYKFNAFPNVSRCGGNWFNDYWMSGQKRYCANYPESKYNSATMLPMAVNTGTDDKDIYATCWGYKCKDGYVMTDALECVSKTTCTGQGKMINEAGECTTTGMCAYGLCYSDAARTQCVTVETNKLGGRYPNEIGVCQTCPSNQYVVKSGNVFTCSSAGVADATRPQIKNCENCTDTDKFKQCVATGNNAPCAPAEQAKDIPEPIPLTIDNTVLIPTTRGGTATTTGGSGGGSGGGGLIAPTSNDRTVPYQSTNNSLMAY